MQPTNTSQMRQFELRVYAWGALLMVASALAGRYVHLATIPISIPAPVAAVSPEVAPAISEWKAATADREANELWGEKRDLRLDYAHAAAAPARPAVTNGVTRNAERDELQRAMQEL